MADPTTATPKSSKYDRLIAAAQDARPAIAIMIVVHPCDETSLRGVLDGPLAFDNAISPMAAQIKGLRSPVARRAQIIVVPDLEAGNMLAKNLTFLADADAAGVVLGARAPIALRSRADSVRSRLASCAVASLYAAARRRLTLVEV